MRRFGNQETEQEHRFQSGGVSANFTAGKRSETVHAPDEMVNLWDRILLRKYSEAPSVSSSKVGLGVVGTTSVPSCSVGGTTVYSKKRRRFVGKGNTKASGIGTDVGESHLRGSSSLLNIQGDESSSGTFPPKIFSGMSDFARLYYTLVRDGALPIGYLDEFLTLERPARRATKRSRSFACSISDATATTALSNMRQEAQRKALEVSTISDQLVIAADLRPKKFRTRWQRAIHDGPTARKDAEAAERDRWIQLLSNLLRSPDTPMGKLSRNAQIESPFGTKIPRLAHCRTRNKISEPLETAHRAPPSQVFGALCSRGLEACPLLVHLLTGGGRDRGQAQGHSVVLSVIEGTLVSGKPWKTATSGAQIPDDVARSF